MTKNFKKIATRNFGRNFAMELRITNSAEVAEILS